MTTFEKTFPQLDKVGFTPAFSIGNANDHTFIVKVSDIDTSVDFNLQISLNGADWADLEATDVQKTADGVFKYSYSGVHCGSIRGAYKAQVGGTEATVTVGTVVFTAVGVGVSFEEYTIETAVGVAAGAETAEITGKAILITGNAASSIAQVQAAIAANAAVAAVITADALTLFAADGPANLAGSDSAKIDIQYKGGE